MVKRKLVDVKIHYMKSIIHQTREILFHPICKHQEAFFNQVQSV